jgi:SAM-dependent methyltransferase
MTGDIQDRWSGFYQANAGRAPRPFFLKMIEQYPDAVDGLTAVDLGCGNGIETAALLQRGWRVLAIDYQAEALDRLRSAVPAEALPCLNTQQASFNDETLTLPQADLIYAGYSLPFCSPGRFPVLWQVIRGALRPNGRFGGQLFGVHDAWAGDTTMNFHTADAARALFDGLSVEYFNEFEGMGETATQGMKYWHYFDVIAVRT